MDTRIKIAIADDHGLMRQGLASMLENVPDIEIVGVAAGGEEAINLISRNVPDVFLMDIIMRGMSGIEAARWIIDAIPEIKVILISGEINKDFISTGIKAGVSGYVLKSTDKEELLNAIRTVARGGKFFSDEITSYVFQEYYNNEKKDKISYPKSHATNLLTHREEEILRHIALGKSLKEISGELFISIKTVETHQLNIKSKLNLTNTAQLVRFAIENGIITIPKSEAS